MVRMLLGLCIVFSVAGCKEAEQAPASTSRRDRPAAPSDSPDEGRGELARSIQLISPDGVESKGIRMDLKAEGPEAGGPEASEEPKVLIVGSKAPQISIAEWAKGEPVTELKPDNIYVVEFWATWCAPCKATMPHLAALQNEYGDKVTFIGVTDEDSETVKAFLAENANGTSKSWSDVLTYRIAIDKEGETNEAFMLAAEQSGIPCAFVVGRTGRIEWIGSPADMDEPLSKIVDGTWDLTAVAAAARLELDMELAKREVAPLIGAALNEKDYSKAIRLIEGLMAKFPSSKELPLVRLQFQIQGNQFSQANENAKLLIEQSKDDAETLSQLAWMMATGSTQKGMDLELAASAAEQAVKLSEEKNADYIDSLAQVKFRQGLLVEAIALQKKAIEVSPPQFADDFKQHLEEMEAAAAAPEAESK